MNGRLPELSPVSQKEIEDLRIRTRNGAAPLERGEDLLERYIRIPNRMLLLYSSEDEIISKYVIDHWSALDGLSGEICDIYTSLMQITGDEDVYSIMGDIRNVPGVEHVRFDKLPMILLWSDQASLCVSLKDLASDSPSTRNIFRNIFQYLHEINRGIDPSDEMGIHKLIEDCLPDTQLNQDRYIFNFAERIEMTSHDYKADRGAVILGAGARARDITTSQSWGSSPGELEKLAEELGKLRQAMRSESSGSDPSRDIAIGQIATAENAAKSGDGSGTLTALKAAGSWALSVAEKIGVSVAAAALKTAIGLP